MARIRRKELPSGSVEIGIGAMQAFQGDSSSPGMLGPPNWNLDFGMKPVSNDIQAALRYFERAGCLLRYAAEMSNPPDVRSYLLSQSIWTCDSLSEILTTLSKVTGVETAVQQAVRDLAYRSEIQSVRNFDVHGHPLPVCFPGDTYSGVAVSRQGSAATVAAPGAGVAIEWDAAVPLAHTSPTRSSDSRFEADGALLWGCQDGTPVVFSSRIGGNRNIPLLEVASEFLKAAQPVVVALANQRGVQLAASQTSEPSDDATGT